MKPRTYLHTFFNTLASPRYYIEILNLKMSFSWRFFLMSYFLLSILSTIFFITMDIPVWQKTATAFAQEIQTNYPDSLEFHWDGAVLTTKPNQPLNIPYPKSMPKG